MTRKTPVLIACMGHLSGVTSWAAKLRDALSDHPRYDVQLIYIGRERSSDHDICVPTIDAAHKYVRSVSPVVIVPNYVWDLFLSAFEPGVCAVGICHADSEEQYYRPLSWYEPLISQFIAVSRECTERLTERVWYRRDDITTLPYGICVPPTLERGYQSNPLRIVYAGRVTQPQKRVRDFVPLVEQLLKSKVTFVFDIVGAGDEYKSLEQAMRDRFPAGYVRFHTRKPHRQMSDVWTGHDVFVQVSDFEGTSVSMLEAMAHGTVPVVTSASSGIADVIRHEQNGFVSPVGNMAAMARNIARLAEDPKLLRAASYAAYQTAQAYSIDSHCGKFVQVLDRATEADQERDLSKRYGMFSPAHPLIQQRQFIVRQQQQITRLRRRASRRSLRGGFRSLLSKKSGLFSRMRFF
jgi:glycosyltransferase involved in cell wall biosynthesis